MYDPAAADSRSRRRRSMISTTTSGWCGCEDPTRTHTSRAAGRRGGLRCGEMMALEWSDVDLAKAAAEHRTVGVEGSRDTTEEWPATLRSADHRLAAALRDHRHLKGPRVICANDGSPLTQRLIQGLVARAARRRALRTSACIVLRHTFCSHLAMRGAPARAIQEFAGHADLTTTQRYMHFSPAALENAIRLLDRRGNQRGTRLSRSAKNVC